MPPSSPREGNQDLHPDRKEGPLKEAHLLKDNQPGDTRTRDMIGIAGSLLKGRTNINNPRGATKIGTDKEDLQDKIIKEDLQDRITKEDLQGRIIKEDLQDRIIKGDLQDRIIKEDLQDRIIKEDLQDRITKEDLQDRTIKGELPDPSSKGVIPETIKMVEEVIHNKEESLLPTNTGTLGGSTGTPENSIEGTLKGSTTKGGWPRRSNRTGMHPPGIEDLPRDSRQRKEMGRTSAPIAKGRYTETPQAVFYAVGAARPHPEGNPLTIPEEGIIPRKGIKDTGRTLPGVDLLREGNVVWRTG
jgi:hypothetical protein